MPDLHSYVTDIKIFQNTISIHHEILLGVIWLSTDRQLVKAFSLVSNHFSMTLFPVGRSWKQWKIIRLPIYALNASSMVRNCKCFLSGCTTETWPQLNTVPHWRIYNYSRSVSTASQFDLMSDPIIYANDQIVSETETKHFKKFKHLF